MSRLGASVVLGAFLTSCGFPKAGPAPGPLGPSAASAAERRWPGTTSAQLEQGRSSFVAACNGCHDYPDLQAVAEGRWPQIVKEMGGKAHLSSDQSTALLRFILSARSPG